jgi:hypothetical protein
MSATVPTSDTDGTSTSDDASKKLRRLQSYLQQQTETQGELYFKSRFIADEVGLSAKEIGALMVQLEDTSTALEIERWSYTSATTWRIAPGRTS